MRKLHPATIIVALLPRLKEVVQAAIPILVGAFASGHSGNQDWIVVGIGSFTGIFAIATYWTTRYDVLPDHVAYKSGWIFRKDRRIPLVQIQNVNIHQNVLDRIFKVATVNVETAMGHGRDLKLSVLSLKNAESLREEILGAAHIKDGDTPDIEEPIVRLNRHDLLIGALTENHFMQMFLAISALSGPTMGVAFKFASKLSPSQATGVTVGGITVLVFGSWAWGVVSYYLKYGDFQVRTSENVFRISYGLLNKVQMAIRPGRIELIQLTATIPQRLMGRTNLRVGTASSFGEAGVLAPVALMVESHVAVHSASQIFDRLQIANLQWQPFDPIFYISRVVRGLTNVAVVAALAFVLVSVSHISLMWVWGICWLISLPVFAGLAGLFLARPENGFAITEDFIIVRQGYYHQSISAMPISRIENVAVTQPFWWVNRRAVRVTVQAMKQRIHIGAMPISAIEHLRGIWIEKNSDSIILTNSDPVSEDLSDAQLRALLS